MPDIHSNPFMQSVDIAGYKALEEMRTIGGEYAKARKESADYWKEYYRTRNPEKAVKEMERHIEGRAQSQMHGRLKVWREARADYMASQVLLNAWNRGADETEGAMNVELLLARAQEIHQNGQATVRSYDDAETPWRNDFFFAAAMLQKNDPLSQLAGKLDAGHPSANATRRGFLQQAAGLSLAGGMGLGGIGGMELAADGKEVSGAIVGAGIGALAGSKVGKALTKLNRGITLEEFRSVSRALAGYADCQREAWNDNAHDKLNTAFDRMWDSFRERRDEIERITQYLPKSYSADVLDEANIWEVITDAMAKTLLMAPSQHAPDDDHKAMLRLKGLSAQLEYLDTAYKQAEQDIRQWGATHGIAKSVVDNHVRLLEHLRETVRNTQDAAEESNFYVGKKLEKQVSLPGESR